MKISYAGKFWLFVGLPGCVAFWAVVGLLIAWGVS